MNETYTFTVEIYTEALTITGSYDLPLYRRVSDAINSRLHRFITLRDAAVAPLWRPQQSQRVPQLLVDWSNALLVATIAEPAPPPGLQAPASPRDAQPMMFFTPVFALRADFYKRTDMELVSMLSEMTDDFIALSAVSIYPLQGGAPLARTFVCLNRHRVQALYAVGAHLAHAPIPASPIESSSVLPAATPPPIAPPPPIPDIETATAETPATDDPV
ncbi:MAG: hypothetical protein OHK0015_46980 [Chloroflexi bacterium OHK40]